MSRSSSEQKLLCSSVCGYVADSYRAGRFCDLEVVCGDRVIPCHRVVLASISPWLRSFFLSSPFSDELHFPPEDFSAAEVADFVDAIYAGLSCSSSEETELRMSISVSSALGLQLLNDRPKFEEEAEIVSAEEEEEPEFPKKRKRGRPRKIKTEEVSSKRPRRVSDSDWIDEEESSSAELDEEDEDEVDEEEEDSVAFSQLQSQFRQCTGTVLRGVTLHGDWEPSSSSAKRKGIFFRAIVGVRNLQAVPLAWSDPETDEEITRQFLQTSEHFRRQFGLSEATLFRCSKQNKFRKKLADEANREYGGKSREALEAALTVCNSQISALEAAGAASSDLSVHWEATEVVDLELTTDLDSFDHLAVLSFSNGAIHCYPMVITNEDEEAGRQCIDTLFEVWRGGGRRKSKVPNCRELTDCYERVSRPFIQREFLEKLLLGESSGSVPEKQCSDCGLLLPYLTKRDKQKYRTHKERHEREKFTCDCPGAFGDGDSNEKRRHILLVHSGGRYIKCEQCAYIGTHNQVRTHAQTNHKAYICDVCGKEVPTKAALCVHALDHKSYRCEICGLEILGRHKYARHVDTNHTGLWPCEVCGNTFKSRAYMQKHRSIMHQTDEHKPHQCLDCGKGFVTSNSLKTHRMNVHIKSRPYACRYGCGAAYNDSSNRGHHERKKHGGNFDPSKPIITMT